MDRLREEVASSAEHLSNHYGHLAKRVRRPDHARHDVNSLGEDQGTGARFDNLCARYDSAQGRLEQLQALRDGVPDLEVAGWMRDALEGIATPNRPVPKSRAPEALAQAMGVAQQTLLRVAQRADGDDQVELEP